MPHIEDFSHINAGIYIKDLVLAMNADPIHIALFHATGFKFKHDAYLVHLQTVSHPKDNITARVDGPTATVLQLNMFEDMSEIIVNFKLVGNVTEDITAATPQGSEDLTENSQIQQRCAEALIRDDDRRFLADMSIQSILKFNIFTDDEYVDLRSVSLTPVFKWSKPQSTYGLRSGYWTLAFHEVIEDAIWRAGHDYKVLLRMVDDHKLSELRSRWRSGVDVVEFS